MNSTSTSSIIATFVPGSCGRLAVVPRLIPTSWSSTPATSLVRVAFSTMTVASVVPLPVLSVPIPIPIPRTLSTVVVESRGRSLGLTIVIHLNAIQETQRSSSRSAIQVPRAILEADLRHLPFRPRVPIPIPIPIRSSLLFVSRLGSRPRTTRSLPSTLVEPIILLILVVNLPRPFLQLGSILLPPLFAHVAR